MLSRQLQGAQANAALIAEELDLEVSRVQFLLELEQLSPLSLDAQSKDDGSVPVDLIPSQGPSPEHYAITLDRRECVLRAIETLKPRVQEIIKRRFGLSDGEVWTLERLGKHYGLTRERIRQIEAKALHQLYARSERLGLSDYMTIPKKRPFTILIDDP
jgi:RNA polymerase primary sigma factor